MKLRLALIFAFVSASILSVGQTKEISYLDFIGMWLTTSERVEHPWADYEGEVFTGFLLEDVSILSSTENFFEDEGKNSFIERLKNKYPEASVSFDSADRLIISNDLLLHGVKGGLQLVGISIRSKVIVTNSELQYLDFLDLYIQRLEYIGGDPPQTPSRSVSIVKCEIDTLDLRGEVVETIIQQNVINDYLYMDSWGGGKTKFLYVSLNTFSNKFNSKVGEYFHGGNGRIHLRDINTEDFGFWRNKMDLPPEEEVFVHAKADNYTFSNNDIRADIDLSYGRAGESFSLTDNAITGHVSLDNFSFSETDNQISWYDLKGKLAPVGVDGDLAAEQLQDSIGMDKLIRTYYQIYLIYKNQGNIRYANSVYSEMKDIFTSRNKYTYETEGGLDNWFRWRLGSLLKFYTDNGTDPARALVVSFYILIFFTFVYVFFPSDWDVTRKTELLQNMRSAVSNKEKGTFKLVLKSIGLISLSLINAFTLSLNAFVTLGFGTIPTHGIARYLCIIQGFLGWFLLSILTVALINQVLF